MEQNRELEEQVEQLVQTVSEMRSRIAQLEGKAPANGSSDHRDRRGFLKLGTGAVLGALGWAAVKAVPASANTGGNMLLGCANTADAATTLTATANNPSPVLSAVAQGTTFPAGPGIFAGPLQGRGTSGSVEGVDGWASGLTAYGVYGLTDSGYGVVGESNTGIGLYARTSGRLRQERRGASGQPGYLPNLYEQVRDFDGILWINNSTADATGAGWRRVNTLRTDAASGSGNFFVPLRRIDTRSGGAARRNVGMQTPITVAPSGSGNSAVPADAVAVVGNLTATSYTGGGFLAIMPGGIAVGTGAGQYDPNSSPSSLNFQVGQAAIANAFVCGLDSLGRLQVYVGGHPSHFIIDITGYIQ